LAPIPVTVEGDGISRYPEDAEAAVHFSVLEGLQNVAKYAVASHAVARLSQADGSLSFEVADDGQGFDSDPTSYGTGLQGIADRLAALGGRLKPLRIDQPCLGQLADKRGPRRSRERDGDGRSLLARRPTLGLGSRTSYWNIVRVCSRFQEQAQGRGAFSWLMKHVRRVTIDPFRIGTANSAWIDGSLDASSSTAY
jgi:hypothetical protein